MDVVFISSFSLTVCWTIYMKFVEDWNAFSVLGDRVFVKVEPAEGMLTSVASFIVRANGPSMDEM